MALRYFREDVSGDILIAEDNNVIWVGTWRPDHGCVKIWHDVSGGTSNVFDMVINGSWKYDELTDEEIFLLMI